DLQTALADLNNQVTALQEAQQAQDSANTTVNEAIKAAANNNTTVTKSGTVMVSTDEAMTKAQEIKGQIEAVVSENQQIAATNATEQARYEADKQKAEAHLKEDGYASELINQSLVFVQEPTAKHTVVKSDGTVVVTDSIEDTRVILHQGETVTVTYTGLENSSYNHTKIAKVVYTYTAKDAIDSLQISTDPTVTVTFYGADVALADATGEQAGAWSSHLGMSIQFFDESNQAIMFTADAPAALAFNSLNRTKVYAGSGYGETIQNLSSNIKVVTINGSSIVYDNGVLHASGYNDYKSNGSRYEANPASGDPDFWDG
ncbi:GbpC/Spa domain-containing protein, partial [Streptococcus gallolyticus]|uniref:GbpC/Spa domain-containing protein n=1 Tax=Streptococcus gallolyticus TaxID=315405 RepID=UPI000AFFAA55